MRTPVWFCLAILLLACQPTLSSLTFSVTAVELTSRQPAPLPTPRGASSQGKTVPVPPDAVWTVEPGTLAQVRGSALVPLSSGDGALVLTVNGGRVSARLPLTVRLVDAVRLRCGSQPCAVRMGQTVRLKTTVLSGEQPLAGADVRCTSSNTSVANVDDECVVKAVAPGQATIQASADQQSTSLVVTVAPVPDEVVIICPSPAFSVAYKQPLGFRGTGTGCQASPDHPIKLLGQLRANGVLVPAPDLAWRSTDESVAIVSGGVVTGLAKGTTLVEASAAGLSVSMPVNVVAQASGDDGAQQCPEQPELESMRSVTVRSKSKTSFLAHCPGGAAELCFKNAVPKSGDEDQLYVAADRCCCELVALPNREVEPSTPYQKPGRPYVE